MRVFTTALLLSCLGANSWAQTGTAPPVRFGPPTTVTTGPANTLGQPPAPLPPPLPGEGPPPPPPGFNVGTPVGPPVSQPVGPQPYFPPPQIIQQSGPTNTYRVWGSFDYLLMFSKGDNVPPLVSALNSGGLTTLTDDTINDGARSGFRATVGAWFDLSRTFGIEANYMWYAQEKDYVSYTDGPGQVLARPFIDARTGKQSFVQLSNETGTIRGFARTYTIFDADGWEVNGLFRVPAMFREDIHLIAGFRSWSMNEQLGVEGLSYIPATKVGVSNFDEFRTRNQFYGAQIGARWNYVGERWTLDVTGKFAVGGVGQEAVLQGLSTRSTATGSTTTSGGLFNQATNIGDYDRTKVAFMPELAINVGYRVTSFATLFVGYNFLYINNVMRPGGQVDNVVNPALIPFSGIPAGGSTRPMFLNFGESFWMQGVTFGVALKF